MFQEGNTVFCLFISPNRPLRDYFRIKTRGGKSPKLLGKKILLLCPIIFTGSQQLVLKHAVTGSDLEGTPRKGGRVKWRKALCCSVPGLFLACYWNTQKHSRGSGLCQGTKISSAEKPFLKESRKASRSTSKNLLLRSFSDTWSLVQSRTCSIAAKRHQHITLRERGNMQEKTYENVPARHQDPTL